METNLAENPGRFYDDLKARVMQAAKDIYGPESEAIQFLEKAAVDENIKFYSFPKNTTSIFQSVGAGNLANVLGENLAQLLWGILRKDTDYFTTEGLSGFWGDLEDAGMSSDDIGRYFERYSEGS